MTENLLTIALDGDITLLDFSTAMGRFRLFVHALLHEVAGRGKVAWRIEDLQTASAIATVRGESTDPEAAPRVVRAFASVGEALQERGAWGRKVTVSGLIGREPYQKRPVVIRQIKEVKILKDVTPGTYRQARGILKREEGREKAGFPYDPNSPPIC